MSAASPSRLSLRTGLPWLLLSLLPGALAVAELGRVHPDEVYQLLEPAFFRARGYGLLAWEWRVGLRNWALPLAFSGLIRLADLLGLADPRAIRAVLALGQAVLHGGMLLAAYRFSERRVGPRAAAFATAVLGLQGSVLIFAGRTLGESLSTAFFVMGCEALDRPGPSRRAGLLGGGFLGLAVVARYGSGVLVAGALLWLLLERRWERLGWTCLAGGGVALALGALDAVTWGAPFHSFIAYAEFNVLSGEAARQFGSGPWHDYVKPFLQGLPLWAWAALALRDRGRSLPALAGGLYLAALLATPHKEERFLYPALVLFSLAALPPLVRRLGAVRPVLQALGALALLAGGLATGASYPAADRRGDEFRAIVKSTRDPAAKGLLIMGEGIWGTGGFFYLGRNLPWNTCDWPQDRAFQQAMGDARFNRVVTEGTRGLTELRAAGFHVVGREGRFTRLTR